MDTEKHIEGRILITGDHFIETLDLHFRCLEIFVPGLASPIHRYRYYHPPIVGSARKCALFSIRRQGPTLMKLIHSGSLDEHQATVSFPRPSEISSTVRLVTSTVSIQHPVVMCSSNSIPSWGSYSIILWCSQPAARSTNWTCFTCIHTKHNAAKEGRGHCLAISSLRPAHEELTTGWCRRKNPTRCSICIVCPSWPTIKRPQLGLANQQRTPYVSTPLQFQTKAQEGCQGRLTPSCSRPYSGESLYARSQRGFFAWSLTRERVRCKTGSICLNVAPTGLLRMLGGSRQFLVDYPGWTATSGGW